MKILVINAGSSSVKFTLFDMDQDVWLAKGQIERMKTQAAVLKYTNHRGQKFEKNIVANSYEAAISAACLALCDNEHGVIGSLDVIKGIGHRVVHGGAEVSGSLRISEEVKQTILDCYEVAPLHNPPNFEGIEACEYLFPEVPMVAVFDTAFHQTMPAAAYTYAIPANVAAQHKLRRYGFHGTSHRYVALAGSKALGRDIRETKLITAHLGNGCSITAINQGQVADTSMGVTPLEGLVMGTRSGDIDPALVLFLCRAGHTPEDVDKMLNKSSGLLGLAGIGSGDMRDIIAAADGGNAAAKLALDVFVHRLQKYIGAYATVLNGFDALIFTGGIGENSSRIRTMVCEKLTYLGIELDPAKNRANELIISRNATGPKAMAVPTNEELMIARETARLLS